MAKASAIPEKPSNQLKIKNRALIEKRRQQISDSAMKLFAEKGYHNTSVRDIAKLSNISTGSIYDYVRNKEDILYLVSQRFFENLEKEMGKALKGLDDPLMKLKATIEAAVSIIDNFQEYVLITYRESKYFKKSDLIGIFQQESFIINIFFKIIDEGNRMSVFNVREPFAVANLLSLMTHCWALKRYNLKELSLFNFKETLIETVLDGITERTKHTGP
ncbi:MAG: TetR/AcrR family transcriptional regulator [Deltaproteobacteria bacterium]|nr:TetR/AcrR family transcriptional regulator [Deltaproteobacteria bacterium]